ncbi:TPA: hypothetical protein DD449_00955 [Candidatus Berkelbacteria bacterium]|uniref:Uncharacterized protein n=1 Tax=Berkelbacteria bacterium GW2011_GWE1_39_12 TaxID=1618337 RepID=A0A0G4B5G5_9BACT|nr:MAG: hypothetical protein UT28_C0001G0896 [Berkelbacteria bacterium GW2011_GWE1_39_12]HBO60240.1 hypothetical protein [Candidatus Berkelbacteria bacterium]
MILKRSDGNLGGKGVQLTVVNLMERNNLLRLLTDMGIESTNIGNTVCIPEGRIEVNAVCFALYTDETYIPGTKKTRWGRIFKGRIKEISDFSGQVLWCRTIPKVPATINLA